MKRKRKKQTEQDELFPVRVIHCGVEEFRSCQGIHHIPGCTDWTEDLFNALKWDAERDGFSAVFVHWDNVRTLGLCLDDSRAGSQ